MMLTHSFLTPPEPYKLDPNLSIRGRRSIVSDLDWVCEESWIPAFSQVGLAMKVKVKGELLYSVHLLCRCSAWHALLWLAQVRSSKKNCNKPSFLSDHYGRIPAILSSNLVALVSGIAIPFVTEYVTFCLLR